MNQSSDNYYYQSNSHSPTQSIPPFALSSKIFEDYNNVGIHYESNSKQIDPDAQSFFNEHMEKILDSELKDSQNLQIVSEDLPFSSKYYSSQQNHQIVPVVHSVPTPTILTSRSNSPIIIPSQNIQQMNPNSQYHQNTPNQSQSDQQQLNYSENNICYYQYMNDQEKMSVSNHYCKILQLSTQLFNMTKIVYSNPYITDEEMDLLMGYSAGAQFEINSLKSIIEKKKYSNYTQQNYHYSQSPNGATISNPHDYNYQMNDHPCSETIKDGASVHTTPKTKTKSKSSPSSSNPRNSPTYINLTENLIKAQNKKTKKSSSQNRVCVNCKTTDTPEWRRGPQGAKTLCNACGIRYRLSKQKTNDPQIPTSEDEQTKSTMSQIPNLVCGVNLYNNQVPNNNNNNVPNMLLGSSQEFSIPMVKCEQYCMTSDDHTFLYSD
ncbi:putative GATA-binding transcription factor [Heterostelium album PN500]|uniref:Putative GATA-binding transcription factor n=1 Tax=Heterostelium pallidum (strain ATCC 26659 / Pp 5 / PN500) TaxID=670386 RepID=D3BM69_HETP5|nr:putative GATA-binding transcription factor [Heterostelium album PN500]EFA77670.1 putative GATA-binding transcription factor [Heterostelium album PN500]|eukprot:XP_020429798.1 putative GATA-binding transcription factor [Heterostelium album PN500]